MTTTTTTPDPAWTSPPTLAERCAALALRLCPVAAAHLVVARPGGTPQAWSAASGPTPAALGRAPAWDALLGEAPLVAVPDAAADGRLAGLPEVCAPGGIRALARLRIPLPEGAAVLWLLDSRPRSFAPAELAALADFAELVRAALAGASPEPAPAAEPRVGLEALLRNATDLVAVCDRAGAIQYASPALTRILGYEPAELAGRSGCDFLHPDDAGPTSAEFRAALRAPGPRRLSALRLHGAGGQWHTVEATIASMLDDPAVGGVVVNARDVTERVAVEQARRASEAAFLAIFQNAPLGIVATASDGTIVLVNQALADLFGYGPEELAGRPLELLLPEAHHEAHRELRAGYLAAPAPRSMGHGQPLFGRRRDGGPVAVEVSLSAVERLGERLAVAFVVDVRGRLGVELALRESEERYRRLIELSPDVVLVVQGEQIVFINSTGARLLAAAGPEQIVGRALAELIHPEERELSRERILAVQAGVELSPVERRVIGLDGRERVLELAPAGITYAGAPAVMAIARDITERRRAEQQVRFQASVLDQMGDAVVVIDDQRRVVYLNPTAERQYGRTLDTARGAPLNELFHVDYFHPDDAADALAAMRTYGLWRGECRHMLADGRSLVVEVAVVALRGEEAGGMVAVIRDITARRQAEERLRLLESVVTQAHDAVIITEAALIDEPGPRILYVNEAFSRITGYPPDEVIGRSPRFMRGPETDPQALAAVRAALVAGEPIRIELCNYRRDGQPIWIDLSITPVIGAGERVSHFIAIQRDITERKQLEAKLLQSQKLESIGRLAGGIAHDFNNLLTAIGGYADLVLDVVDDAGVRADIAEIRKGVDRASALTGQLLAFARRQPHSPRALELNGVVAQIEKLLQRLLGPDIALRTTLTTAPTPVVADRNQIEQVLINLAVNARDAMPRGGTLTIRTAITPDPEVGEVVRLTVADSGSGMSEDVLAHAFEPFFTTKGPGQGTGLGLATCYGIVRQHGGRISIDSAAGAGTTITVELPARGDQAGATGPSGVTSWRRAGSETVLVVDDDPAVRVLATRVLRDAGYTVLEAPNGRAAIAILTAAGQAMVQLVITDVLMPELNGRQLGTWIAHHRPHTRMLYMSGHATPEGEAADLAPLAPLLAKPFSVGSLLEGARAALDVPG